MWVFLEDLMNSLVSLLVLYVIVVRVNCSTASEEVWDEVETALYAVALFREG
jgi:hypothetical protein